MNKVVHFEIPAEDMDRAKKFYTEVFGWETQGYGDPEVFLVTTTETDPKTGPKNPGAINGDVFKRTEDLKHPSVVMDVPNIDEHLKKIEAAGGKTIKGKQELPGMGWFASFEDSEGNVLGLWQNI